MTLLPVAPKENASEEDWKEIIKYFPFVGSIFAAANIGLVWAFNNHESLSHKTWLLALAIVLVNLFISGGLHLDGLMDSFDGIAASKPNREECRAVMRDSRSGAFGVMAALSLLLSKVICLAEANIDSHHILLPIALVPIISRINVVLVMAFQKNDGELLESKVSSLLAQFDKAPALTIAVVFMALALISASAFSSVLLISSYLAALWLGSKLYGHSGDSLGASIEISEALGFLLICFI